jgi:hypothetical protein
VYVHAPAAIRRFSLFGASLITPSAGSRISTYDDEGEKGLPNMGPAHGKFIVRHNTQLRITF